MVSTWSPDLGRYAIPANTTKEQADAALAGLGTGDLVPKIRVDGTSNDVSVGALEPKFWIALNQAIGRAPNVAEIVGNADQQAKTRTDLAAIFETKTAAEWHARRL